MQGWMETLLPERPAEFIRMEEHARLHNFPIIGPLSGQVCYVIARIQGTRRVFELGSGYGYSTAWFARAVRENSAGESSPLGSLPLGSLPPEVHHCVWHADLSEQARTHLAALGYSDLVQFHIGEAIATLHGQQGPFDLIFLDIDKVGYPDALPVIEEKLRPGGVLIIDNMLWNGRTWDEADREPETEAIRRTAQMLGSSPRWEQFIVAVRDGILVARFNG